MKKRVIGIAVIISMIGVLFLEAIPTDAAQEELDYIPGEVIVSYADSADIHDVASQYDMTVAAELDTIAPEQLAVVEISDENTVDSAISELQNDPEVLYAEPNYLCETMEGESDDVAVNDAYYSQEYNLSKIQIEGAWNQVKDLQHEKVKVAVLDTGALLTHEDLTNVINQDLSVQIQNGTVIGALDVNGDATGHGTHVAGILAAESNNQSGIAGVASGYDNQIVDLMIVDVEQNGKVALQDVIAGINYAVAGGAKVINMSLGTVNQSTAFENACNAAAQQGTILVASAGNIGSAGITNGTVPVAPAYYASTIGVINTTQSDTRSNTSCYGINGVICAPGTSIFSTTYDGSYGYKTGTSMAAPVVSGIAAMLCYVDNTLTLSEVKHILYATADDLYQTGKDNETGYGRVNAEKALEETLLCQKIQWENPFADVNETNWFYDSVEYVYRRKIMTGLNHTEFGAAQELARAQFATILHRMNGSPQVEYTSKFPDVSDGTFYTTPVLWAGSVGIVNGYEESGRFGPGDPINREQMAVMMYRYAQYKGYDVSMYDDLSSYPDASSVSEYADAAVKWAVGARLISGDQGALNPQGNVNRAVCATIMMRFLSYYP